MAGPTSSGRQENAFITGRLARVVLSLRRSWAWTRGRTRDGILWHLSLTAAVALAVTLIVDAVWVDLFPSALPVLALVLLYVLLLFSIPRATPRMVAWLRHVHVLGVLALLFVRGATPGDWPFLYAAGLAVAPLAAIFTAPWAVLGYTVAADTIILWRTWPAGLGPLNLGTVAVTGLGATLAAFIFARAEKVQRQATALEHERAEALRLSAATLEARVAERTEQLRTFIATVSHDLRAPLSVIRVYAEAELQPDCALPEGTRLTLQVILDETAILAEHVDNMLYAARIDAAALEPHSERVAADELVADVVARVRGRFLLAQRALRIAVAADLPPVRADARFARMILGNLLDNAHKYSPPPVPVEIGGSYAGGYVSIHVRDHGPGIPSAEREQIFERYRRGSTPGGSGLGLGLWICRELAQRQGGEIELADAADGGSVFTLRLPVYADPDVVPGAR